MIFRFLQRTKALSKKNDWATAPVRASRTGERGGRGKEKTKMISADLEEEAEKRGRRDALRMPCETEQNE